MEQVKAAAPPSLAIWLLFRSTIMSCLAELVRGMTMADAINQEKNLLQWIDGFMDDTSLFTNLDRFSKNCNNIGLLMTALKEDWKPHGAN
jgi:hypothetical protein